MFEGKIYVERREQLRKSLGSGLALFIGNTETPMNYSANPFHFRQDSSFLYYFGLDYPDLAAVIDVDEGVDTVFGDDLTVDDIIWTGPQPTLQEKCRSVGVERSTALAGLENVLKEAAGKGRKIHFLPQYKAESIIALAGLINLKPNQVNSHVSVDFIKAVVAQRNVKITEEIEQIESALDVAYEMHTTAMRMAKPGLVEREISGLMEGIALSKGNSVSFPVIFSVHGETLHNHYHGNIMKEGDILVNDCGAESLMHYASDITRTIPVSGKFTDQQKEIYNIVLEANLTAISEIKPGKRYLDIHMNAAKIIAGSLKDLGFMKGDVNEAVEAGAHAMFFPHGLGHMMGLDVHDMENLGEDYVGYDESIKRSDQFGTAYLRLAKELKPGYVITVEPGLYFIPELIDKWKSENKFTQFINYNKVEEYRDFGGMRIEDDVLVSENGSRVLGKPVPKTVEEVESECNA